MIARITKIAAATAAASIALASIAGAAVQFFTSVGGASGMTLQLSPYKAGGIQRGCASKIMDTTLQDQSIPPSTGTVYHVYTNARMKCFDDSKWSEPGAPGTSSRNFTGDKSQCEINYIQDGNGTIRYSLVIRGDSVIGLRWVINRQRIYSFVPQQTANVNGAPSGNTYVVNSTLGSDGKWTDVLPTDAIWPQVLADINSRLAAGIPIEGGLTECYIDSGVKAIDQWNAEFGPTMGSQPSLNPAHFPNVTIDSDKTKDNLLSVAVLAILYNASVEQWTGGQPLNVTNQMERMITGGMVDNWDVFFNQENGHAPLYNFYREPLSGTCVTYKNLIMRGLAQSPNGSTYAGAACTDGTNYHKSGIPDLNCVTKSSETCPAGKPGGGTVNNAVDLNPGAHAYTFMTKFTPVDPRNKSDLSQGYVLDQIRVAKVNGYEPFSFANGNSLPGINGTPDVDSNTNDYFYPNVLDGKYPLWTYNHCFDATNGTSDGLGKFVAEFKLIGNLQKVRSVGLIPLADMESATRTKSTTGPNANRGPGLGRCGFVSPVTGETVRDGMMYMLNDTQGTDSHGNPIQVMPGESNVEMRP